ncbi:MAG: Asp-tRNA(Asn)/Glu-tRNA(Gln) amidotransferase GatCAB subunit B [Candidatus Yonathbacteria bacterium CG10_big_fil_rev_8_21_14_0_10_43_136]|uniref:Aspartyl/glutamyl-tRNA(Asn/Gln) amidotransferase subunit B n=1 Tax=Candidatus Yonathbacteria bacterium CG_4_10_14_0_8_um_filter_43_17 TaxID=1975099 RepID=A0A2M7Q5Q4_9BACT|nr:MAG: Asp-tRNA(Asn)/Glu-tRNA(Gln) amidotransferase GatCAB subunit B [Candidatus Yonathbacteria bacterium CG17_big_fil_post_rev_8_21_14_2_50_43_9]PIR40997.1 MAG: Asp-tRNA(Asn)/Glu-tRNA(Gln) amidotransferase GatCAB subunit B [Candidatus Yonathbacteria bacterium CG10_big_fil_rev_8_21_14_0_10_43_136]PIX57177.1 MAG: Asp-tRNA(Asn)/Glu-tRNA(Gln) amidotransferase subunit GatB [Candidatus Yonathbacteria bacterium CG_4_10_14_3_um_filter_43_12]PIY58776.1 MAG: Asp-tRNA(Asn)/Glu-tRNA(Gln) amidotransferase 
MSEYKLTVGLEVHAELKTKTKMFCNSANDPFNAEPNVNICPVCMAHPGTLPVINKQAVHHVLRVGTALGSDLADFTEFDRKNYFYPDIPKGYQISQYKYPLVSNGILNGIAIERVHLEEDTASSSHEGSEGSLVDYNRAGVPLMELVTKPVIHTAEEAGAFARELQLLLRALGVSDANMEKGEMRVEANISISKTDTLGTKVEVKNLNSFRSVERAIAYEVERMTKILDGGPGEIVQETRGWDEGAQKTFSQRKKESAHDYRYFPDPDLPKLKISEIPEFANEVLRATMPELPWEKRARLVREYGVKPENAEVFTADQTLGGLFEDAVNAIGVDRPSIALIENYITSDLVGLMKGSDSIGMVTGTTLADLITMIKAGDLSSRGAKDTLAILYAEGGHPHEIAKKHNLIQKNDIEALKKIVAEILEDNPTVVADYKTGKTALLQFFIGQGMKASKGNGNPGTLKTLFEEALK